MNWLATAAAWAAVPLCWLAYWLIHRALRRFMAGPPADERAERHYGAKGRASQWSDE